MLKLENIQEKEEGSQDAQRRISTRSLAHDK